MQEERKTFYESQRMKCDDFDTLLAQCKDYTTKRRLEHNKKDNDDHVEVDNVEQAPGGNEEEWSDESGWYWDAWNNDWTQYSIDSVGKGNGKGKVGKGKGKGKGGKGK